MIYSAYLKCWLLTCIIYNGYRYLDYISHSYLQSQCQVRITLPCMQYCLYVGQLLLLLRSNDSRSLDVCHFSVAHSYLSMSIMISLRESCICSCPNRGVNLHRVSKGELLCDELYLLLSQTAISGGFVTYWSASSSCERTIVTPSLLAISV